MSRMSPRAQKVAEQMQRELAMLIQLEVNDPKVGMVVVTGVDVSNDLANARVYVTVMDALDSTAEGRQVSPQVAEASAVAPPGNLQALNRAAGFLRSLLARRISLRKVPKLRFFRDGSTATGQRLSNLIDEALQADQRYHAAPRQHDGQQE